jgi:hypothetical protein
MKYSMTCLTEDGSLSVFGKTFDTFEDCVNMVDKYVECVFKDSSPELFLYPSSNAITLKWKVSDELHFGENRTEEMQLLISAIPSEEYDPLSEFDVNDWRFGDANIPLYR